MAFGRRCGSALGQGGCRSHPRLDYQQRALEERIAVSSSVRPSQPDRPRTRPAGNYLCLTLATARGDLGCGNGVHRGLWRKRRQNQPGGHHRVSVRSGKPKKVFGRKSPATCCCDERTRFREITAYGRRFLALLIWFFESQEGAGAAPPNPRRSALVNRCLTDEGCHRVPPRGVRSRMASSWAAICCSVRSGAAALMPATSRISRSSPPCGRARSSKAASTIPSEANRRTVRRNRSTVQWAAWP